MWLLSGKPSLKSKNQICDHENGEKYKSSGFFGFRTIILVIV